MSDNKVNLLFIIFDDMNEVAARMGGHPQARTPNLDRLADEGVRFTNAQCAVPLCGPSRTAAFFGLYPHTTRCFGHRPEWPDLPALRGKRHLFHAFREAGYDTLATGKVFHHNQTFGDLSAFTGGQGPTHDWGPYPWDGRPETMRTFAPVAHPTVKRQAEQIFVSLDDVPDVPANPERNAPGYRGWILKDRPFRYVSRNDRDLMPDEQSVQWIERRFEHGFDQPFCLAFGVNRPHAPLVAPQEYFDLFPLDELDLAIDWEEYEDQAACLRPPDRSDPEAVQDPNHRLPAWGYKGFRNLYEQGGEALLRKWLQAYLACAAFADAQVGRVLDRLRQSPYADNTLVVVTSDHGYHLGSKQWIFKQSPWEEACRIPLIVSGPGVARGRDCTQPVSNVDIYPTLNECCGLDAAVHPDGTPLEGNSFADLLRDPDRGQWTGPEGALTAVQTEACKEAKDTQPPDPREQFYSLRTPRYRYILCPNGEEELYDHETDRRERNNLARDEATRDLRQRFAAEVRKRIGATR